MTTTYVIFSTACKLAGLEKPNLRNIQDFQRMTGVIPEFKTINPETGEYGIPVFERVPAVQALKEIDKYYKEARSMGSNLSRAQIIMELEEKTYYQVMRNNAKAHNQKIENKVSTKKQVA